MPVMDGGALRKWIPQMAAVLESPDLEVYVAAIGERPHVRRIQPTPGSCPQQLGGDVNACRQDHGGGERQAQPIQRQAYVVVLLV